MKHLIKKTTFNEVEQVPSTTTTIQGSAMSVEELYKKMIVGSIDAAGFVHPIEYDENPDIDNPDILNTFGLDVGEIEEHVRDLRETARREVKPKTKKGEGAQPSPEPLKQEPQPSGDDGK